MSDAAPGAPALPAGDDPVVTLYLTRKKQIYPFRTPRSMRWVVEEIFQRGEYSVLRVPGWTPGTIVDVGANVGAFALFAAVHWPGSRILCFEPVRAAFALLEENLAGIDGVALHDHGLNDTDAEVFLHYGRNNPGEASIFHGPDQRDEGETVGLRRAASELERLGVDRIGILKVDTEGCEVAILRDLAAWLPRTDFVLVEYHREGDRREIDRLLGDGFLLFGGHIPRLNCGVLKYVCRRIVAEHAPAELRRE